MTNYYLHLKTKAILDADYILKGDVNESKEKEIEEFFYSLLKPQVFWGTSGKEATYYRNFESTCNVMRQNGVPEPKKLTAREYLQYLNDLTKQHSKIKRGR